MSSSQINYFATGEDLRLIAETLLEWEQELLLFPAREKRGRITGKKVENWLELVPQRIDEQHYICRQVDAPNVTSTSVDGDTDCIRLSQNPVIEYSPSAPVSKEIVKIGRLFASYPGEEFQARFRALVQKLKASATRLKGSDIWVFPEARDSVRFFRPWIGSDWLKSALIEPQ